MLRNPKKIKGYQRITQLCRVHAMFLIKKQRRFSSLIQRGDKTETPGKPNQGFGILDDKGLCLQVQKLEIWYFILHEIYLALRIHFCCFFTNYKEW